MDLRIRKSFLVESTIHYTLNKKIIIFFILYTGELNYHDIAEESYWMLNCEKILVGNEDTNLCSDSKPCRLVLDSGTSLFTGPSDDLPVLLNKLDNGEGCRSLYDLPEIT